MTEKEKKYDEVLKNLRIYRDHLREVGENDIADELEFNVPDIKWDEKAIKEFIIGFIESCGWSEKNFPPREKCLDWLKKQVQEEPVKLTAVDKRVKDNIIVIAYAALENGDINDNEYKEIYAWLKMKSKNVVTDDDSMKVQAVYCKGQTDVIENPEAFGLQKRPMWSEEDLNRLNNLCLLIEDSNEGTATKQGFIKFLKSLQPQPKKN